MDFTRVRKLEPFLIFSLKGFERPSAYAQTEIWIRRILKTLSSIWSSGSLSGLSGYASRQMDVQDVDGAINVLQGRQMEKARLGSTQRMGCRTTHRVVRCRACQTVGIFFYANMAWACCWYDVGR